jgi:HEAT repeat protein
MDIFGGGSPPQKAQKLKAKVIQKYGDAAVRQKAIEQLAAMQIPEAVQSLLARFTINVEPQTTDLDEKEHVHDLIQGMGKDAVAPVMDFLKRTDTASSWALRILAGILPEPELVSTVADYLQKLGTEYTRDPQKKLVLLQWVHGKSDPKIAPALVGYLDDQFDDVKIAAANALGPLKYEPAREPMLQLLTNEETARRVKTALLQALSESEFGVQGYREKVEKLLVEPYTVDRAGLIKKRS